MSEPVDDLRVRTDKILQTAIDDDDLRALIGTALAAKKKARLEMTCKHCRKVSVQYVEIDDSTAALKAFEILLNQTKGRPDVAAQTDEERIVFERVIYLDGEDSSV